MSVRVIADLDVDVERVELVLELLRADPACVTADAKREGRTVKWEAVFDPLGDQDAEELAGLYLECLLLAGWVRFWSVTAEFTTLRSRRAVHANKQPF